MLTADGQLTAEAAAAPADSQQLPPPSPGLALELARSHLGVNAGSVGEAMEALRGLTADSAQMLCAGCFADFVASDECCEMLAAALGSATNEA
eukprot:4353882-Prymnesium_polylepis.1